ncbi:hypothetical protein KAR91_41620 [Candidatus Pacearchaeota archaeon]|nr:hypothetical protein [Candidatus Pacearchaeota archaeon]
MTFNEFVLLLGVAIIVGLVGWWAYFAFCECLDVGHSVMYCVMTIG